MQGRQLFKWMRMICRQSLVHCLRNCFAIRDLPFRHKKVAARTSKTCRTSAILDEKMICFPGKGMLPKLQERQ
jgi:hypothetical protein